MTFPVEKYIVAVESKGAIMTKEASSYSKGDIPNIPSTEGFWDGFAEYYKATEKLRKIRIYTKHRAGWIFGVDTIDQGRIRGKDYYRFKTWANTNQAFWFIPDQYANSTTLPDNGTLWINSDVYLEVLGEILKEVEVAHAVFERKRKYRNAELH